MKRFISVLLVIALLVPMLCVDVFAADHQVKDFDELKAAIASAANGDVITVASNITLDETLAIENKNITIKGSGKISADNALTTVATRKNTLFVINNSTVKFNGVDENQKLTLDGELKNRIIYSENSTIELTNAVVTKGCPGSDSTINPGGGIFLRGGSLTATDTVFSNNKPGSATGLPQGDGDLNGGAIYSGSTKADIKITGGSFVDNEVKAYGHGAAIYQENGTLNVTGTSFKNNKGHVEGGNAGTQGACIHTRDKVKATISGVTAEIAKGFNTGGFLRSWKSNITVTGSTFTIAGLGDGYGYSGGALCFEGGTSKVTGSTFTCNGSKLYHAGGFIDIVGTGTHVIDGNTMTGAGKDNGQQIASFGGAISVEEGASATVTITNNTIKDTSASDNGGAIAIGTHKGKDTPSTVTMSGNTISNAGTLFWGAQYGGGVFVAPDATVTMTKDTIKDTRSSYGGGVYNEGNLTITGGSSLTGGVGSKLGGEIYNNGDLIVDDATITGNFVGGSSWQQYASHGKNFEHGGTNIYAEKSVTITPNANITTGKDVRVLDGQSKILLTGALTKEIDVSVSEVAGGNETQKRRVGYVVAAGTNGYAVTKSDANFLHYIGRTNKTDANHYSNQPRASYADDKSTGEWDFVLDKDNKKVVLGQRVKLIYHGNLGKLGTNDKEEKTVDVYKNPNFWENQLEEYKVADPKLEGSSFMGWYYWKDGTVGDEESSVQDIKKPDNFKNDLFDFSKVTFQNNVKDTDQIITPNIINTYAGWSQNISIPVLKEWVDAKEADKVDVTVTLSGGEKDITLTLKKTENYFNQFQDLKVFTKSYQPNEEKNMNLKFTPKTYIVVETPIDGFATSYSPQSMIANQVAEVSRFVVTNKKMFKVTYEFVSGTEGKTLPAAIDGYKPTDTTEYADGATVNAKQPIQTSYEDTENNGTWTFNSWDANSKTINKADVKFIGTWTFAETPQTKYKATYEFVSGTEGKTLPAAIEGYKPTDDAEYADKATVTAKEPTQTSYEDTENNGTWTFTSWDANSKTIDGANVKFIGTWTFAAKPKTKYKATYEFKSGTEEKALPTEIEGYKPTDDTEYADGATVTAKEPTQTSYEDTENNGTWTFTSWDQNSKTIDKADVKFVGTWKFTEKTSDFTITKAVDKATYEKAGEVLTYIVIVKNTGEKKLENLILTDALMDKGNLINPTEIKPFELDVKESKEFKYSYTITEDDVKAKSVTNVASVTHGKISKEAKAKSILKEKEKRGDVYVRYETEDGKILDEFAVLIDAPVGTYYYTEEKAFPRYRFVGLAPYSDPAEGYVVEGTQYVVYLYRRDGGERTPDRRDRYEREEKEVEEPIVEAKRKPELNKKDHKQYMYGYPDWTFVPEANITRGEAAAMFARLFKEYPGLDYNYKKYYTDVDESYWGFKEVAYLSEFGILSGYSDGTFRPNNKITRAEFVKIAESFEALTWGLSPYNDVDGGHWAFRYIVSSAAKGWISGYPDGSFRPNSFISRAEAVTIVNKLLERRPDKDYIDTHKPELKPFTDLKPSYWAYYEIYEAVDGHDYNRSFTDIEEHWYRLNNERFVFSQPRYYR